MEEIWKDIPNYEGIYQASNLGNIKSLSRIILRRGKYPFKSEERVLKAGSCIRGYLTVSLNNKTQKVHTLVAMTFLGHVPCGLKLVVNHKNLIKTDNRVENLEIVTQRENTNQKHLNNTSKFVGVTWCNKSKKWKSQIYDKGWKYLGLFDSEEEASEYYENALIAIQNGTEIQVKLKKTSSKYKYVYWNKATQKWKSYIMLGKIKKNLGSFETEEEAYQAILNYLKIICNK